MLGIFIFNPILSRRNIPTIAKVTVTVFITYIAILVVQPEPVDTGTQIWVYLMMICRETVIGLIFGFITDLFFYTVQVAGEVMDMQSGLGMAKVFDPDTRIQMSIFGSFVTFLMYMYFFVTNSHMTLIKLFITSYEIAPIGQGTLNPDLGMLICSFFNDILVMVLKLAMPIIAAEMILHFSVGVLMKAVPQIQIMVVNIQLMVAVGFITLYLVAVPLSEFIDRYIADILESAVNIIPQIFAG